MKAVDFDYERPASVAELCRRLADAHGEAKIIAGGQTLVPLLEDVPCIESAHPSPYSAASGFFGSRPFSRANELLEELGGEPVDWKLP